MESDNYIDSLQIDLKLPSARTPVQARDEADEIADKHVVPAVEKVVEDLGEEIDTSIPKLEIDVGRVRLEDLRDRIESALRNALEKYRRIPGETWSPSPSSSPSSWPSAESLREFAETGVAPWAGGGAPFNPSRLLAEVLKKDPDTFLEAVRSYSEKELAALLVASSSEVEPEDKPRSRQFQEAILARLADVSPKTAAVLSRRLEAWRRFGESQEPPPVGYKKDAAVPDAEAPDATVPDAAIPAQETGQATERTPEPATRPSPGPALRTYRYVEIALTEIPEGFPVVSMNYTASPRENDPEYILSPGSPWRYYRKESIAVPAGPSDSAEVKPEASIVKSAIPEVKSATPSVALETPMARSERPSDETVTPDQRPEMEAGPGTMEERKARVKEAGSEGSTRVKEKAEPSGRFRYVEIHVADIPEGSPVVSRYYSADPGETDPEYVFVPGVPVRYYRKVAASGFSASSLWAEPQSRSLDAETQVSEVTPGTRPELSADHPQGRESGSSGGRYKYVEIGLTDVPESVSVVSMNYTAAPGDANPEYILVPGTPIRYYRKVLAGSVFGESVTSEVVPAVSDAGVDASSVKSPAMNVKPEALENPSGRPSDDSGALDRRSVVQEEQLLPGDVERREGRSENEEESEREHEQAREQASEPASELAREQDREPQREQERDKGSLQASVSPEEVRYKYVEIDSRDVPGGTPVVTSNSTVAPREDAPEYILVPGAPVRYYRKVASRDFGEHPSESVTELGIPVQGQGAQAGLERQAGRDGQVGQNQQSGRDGQVGPDRQAGWNEPVGQTGQTGQAGMSALDDLSIWEVRDFETDIPDMRIPVSDAGLVLLHPFIGRMMENLGLAKKGMFVSPLARIRAVHLLRDLTGSDEPHHNHNLLLEKVLCGLPIGYALPSEWKPTEKEKEEEEALLQAVCEYWRPLKRSSTSALCSSFILRPGILERFEDTWTIRVEGRTIDILMDDLPWELSIIILPWLEKPIAVEWQQE